eukprot:GHVR01077367.1.p1 GENE.GHVR01077367.1~~GHVR01077367.1.p1  ORF type:complete len:335 (+),score=154.51 GHVR01077367.1:137-1141(+)
MIGGGVITVGDKIISTAFNKGGSKRIYFKQFNMYNKGGGIGVLSNFNKFSYVYRTSVVYNKFPLECPKTLGMSQTLNKNLINKFFINNNLLNRNIYMSQNNVSQNNMSQNNMFRNNMSQNNSRSVCELYRMSKNRNNSNFIRNVMDQVKKDMDSNPELKKIYNDLIRNSKNENNNNKIINNINNIYNDYSYRFNNITKILFSLFSNSKQLCLSARSTVNNLIDESPILKIIKNKTIQSIINIKYICVYIYDKTIFFIKYLNLNEGKTRAREAALQWRDDMAKYRDKNTHTHTHTHNNINNNEEIFTKNEKTTNPHTHTHSETHTHTHPSLVQIL